jgi:Protein of unknown function (DUF3830)
MARIKFSFARGGHFTARVMLDKAPKTWEAIRTNLPLTIKAYNARWTGRETHTKLDLPNKPPRENQILNAGLGDVILRLRMVGPRRHRLRGDRVVLRHRDGARLARRIPRQPVRARRPERVAVSRGSGLANLAGGWRGLHHQRRGRLMSYTIHRRRPCERRDPYVDGPRATRSF